jgi:DNA-binding PadR family transcriptional regulator
MTEPVLLSEVEQLVLLAVLRIGEGAYAVPIGVELRQRAGVELSRGSIYVTLERLERKGYLRSRFSSPTPERGGKARRCFRVEPAALPRLRKAQRSLQRLWEGVDLGVEEA